MNKYNELSINILKITNEIGLNYLSFYYLLIK